MGVHPINYNFFYCFKYSILNYYLYSITYPTPLLFQNIFRFVFLSISLECLILLYWKTQFCFWHFNSHRMNLVFNVTKLLLVFTSLCFFPFKSFLLTDIHAQRPLLESFKKAPFMPFFTFFRALQITQGEPKKERKLQNDSHEMRTEL